MTSRVYYRWAALGAGFVLTVAAQAHHSQSEFDLKSTIQIEGTVTKLEWKSPHARLYLDAKNDKGETVSWDLELPSPNTLMRRGWKRDSLKAGDHVKVAASPARNFPTIGIATRIDDDAGKPLFTGTTPVYEPEVDAKGSQ
jgi:hypothetical protein